MFENPWQPIKNNWTTIFNWRKVKRKAKRFDLTLFFLLWQRFSLIDAWVSAYLLIVLRHGSAQSELNRLIKSQRFLFGYVQRLSDEENLLVTKQRETQSLLSITDAENSSRVASILHVLSQLVSFSIFIFMLTKIGADSYANSSS